MQSFLNLLNFLIKLFEKTLKTIYKIVKVLIFFVFLLIFLIFGLIFFVLIYKMLVSKLLKNKESRFVNRFFYDSVIFFIKICLDTFVEVKIWGKQNIPKNGPKIFASNHFSSTDVPFMFAYIKDRIHMIIGPIYKIPVLKNFLDVLEQINANGENRKNVINKSMEYISKGESVYIFPEGDLNNQETFLNFYKGAAKIYIESNGAAPIIPIGIAASKKDIKEIKLFKIKENDRIYKSLNVLSGRYLINIGEPLEFKDLLNSDKTNEEKSEEITKFLKNYIKQLVDEAKFTKFWN